MAIFLYMLLTPSLYYLGSRAIITQFLWSRYSPKFARWADCSACSGTWYGALVGFIGGYGCGLSFLGLPGNAGGTIIAIALCSMTWTPIMSALMQFSLNSLGTAVEDEPKPEPTEWD